MPISTVLELQKVLLLLPLTIATSNQGLTNTHDVSITGTFQYVGNTSDISRTVTIEENASSKLLAEQLNTIVSSNKYLILCHK